MDDDRILCDSPDHQTYQNWSYLLIVGFAFGVPGVVFYSLYMRRRKYKKHQEENRELVERVCKKLEMTDTKTHISKTYRNFIFSKSKIQRQEIHRVLGGGDWCIGGSIGVKGGPLGDRKWGLAKLRLHDY